MKKLFVLLFVFCVKVNAQNHTGGEIQLPVYPSFNEMASVFFSRYTLPAVDYPKEYCFAKKPDGWHIMVIDRTSDRKTIEDYLFWDRSKKQYSPVYLPHHKEDEIVVIPKEYDIWDNKYFNSILPYWGYVGWEADVINDYESFPNPSDSVLNALARAYCSYAGNLLANNLGFSDTVTRFKIKDGLNSLTTDQLNTYRKYEHMAIDTYKRLSKLNPKFENFVADIQTIYANEIMNCFLTLRYFQNEAEAHKELNEDLYDPFNRSLARNYLASCDSNAIIFTNGDGDTYPLLYVQEREGFRKDVLLVNVSLLTSGRYMNHLFYKIGPSDPLSVNLDKKLYQKDVKPYIYVIEKDGVKNPMEIKELIDFINSSDTATKYQIDGKYYDYMPTTSLKISVNKAHSLLHKIVEPNDSSQIVSQIEWKINKPQVLYQKDLAVLDIISCSDFQRSIYFTVTVPNECYLGLEKYFQLEGLAYKFVPIKHEYKDNEYGRIKPIQLYHRLKNEFKYPNLNDGSIVVSENLKRMTMNYRIQFARLASALEDENNNAKAEDILDFCALKFPSSKVPADYCCIQQARCYYKLKKYMKANQLVNEIFNRYTADLDNIKKGISINNEDGEYKKQMGLYVLQELSKLTETYKQSQLHENIKKKFEEYN